MDKYCILRPQTKEKLGVAETFFDIHPFFVNKTKKFFDIGRNKIKIFVMPNSIRNSLGFKSKPCHQSHSPIFLPFRQETSLH